MYYVIRNKKDKQIATAHMTHEEGSYNIATIFPTKIDCDFFLKTCQSDIPFNDEDYEVVAVDIFCRSVGK